MMIALLLSAAVPDFDPLRFFAGETRGEGRIKVLLHHRHLVTVRGSGRLVAGGALALDQAVSEGNKPPHLRHWHLVRTAAGRYEGTLSDARGPVVAEVDGPRLHLRFTSTGGFRVQQWITLSPDARSAFNHLEARRFGVVVARLEETITKVD